MWSLPADGLPFKRYFTAAESQHGLPKGLLGRVAQQESAFRADIISGRTDSSAGARGIMQIVPKWHPNVDPLNVPEAINYAAKFLKSLHSEFGDWQLALAAYNFGSGNVRAWLRGDKQLPDETRNYVNNISRDLGL